ncbi:MAG: pyridoxamine 5'-phosphate oxidase family protein [Oscillospiraceae bacterium]|nr:pyridoxamine 5'-phosphate oxidase family protein [Oscillospiraceae bacterium]
MSRITEIIKEAGAFFLATTDGDQPKVRPLGLVLEADDKILFGIGDFKDVYKQLCANPKAEIVALGNNGHWLRYTGTVVFETDPKYAEMALESAPHLRGIYNEETGNKMMMFHLENAKACEIAVMGEGEDILGK